MNAIITAVMISVITAIIAVVIGAYCFSNNDNKQMLYLVILIITTDIKAGNGMHPQVGTNCVKDTKEEVELT